MTKETLELARNLTVGPESTVADVLRLMDLKDALLDHIDALETRRSMTYGELPESVRGMIQPHEWDNKNISEQRDWAVLKLAALEREKAIRDEQVADLRKALRVREEAVNELDGKLTEAERQRDALLKAANRVLNPDRQKGEVFCGPLQLAELRRAAEQGGQER